MVFNWFRRKFDNSESEPEATPASATESIVEEAPSEVVAEPQTTSESVATDYLAWAKAAYDNIQQQESPSPDLVTPDEPTTPDQPAVVAVSTDLESPPSGSQTDEQTPPDAVESPDTAAANTPNMGAR